MKKYLFVLSIVVIGLIGCSPKEEASSKEKEIVIQGPEAPKEEQYKNFEEIKKNEFLEEGIKEVSILPFSKGIDIIFSTDRKDWKKNQFLEIAKKTVEEFKIEFGFDKSIEIGVSLDYQPDKSQNTETLFSAKLN